MKIAFLAGDIIDARIVLLALFGKNIRTVVYEKEKNFIKRLKTSVKAYLNYCPSKFEGYGIKTKRVKNINEHVDYLKSLNLDLIVVVGTRKLSKDILDCAKIGAINLHTGILPYYRGSDSEYWALKNNDYGKIGATIHFMTDVMDAGDIILEERQTILFLDNDIRLRKRNMRLGAKLMEKAVGMIARGQYSRTPQIEDLAKTYKRKPKEDQILRLLCRGFRSNEE